MKKDFLKNKKAQGLIVGIVLFMIMAVVLTVMCVLYVYMGNTIEGKLQNMTVSTAGNWTEIVDNTYGKVNTAFSALNWLVGLIIIFMFIGTFIGAYFSDEHPVIFILYIIITIILIIVSVPISNMYEKMYETQALTSTFEGFGIQQFIFAHLPTWIMVLGFIGSAIMVSKLLRRNNYG